jgi:hypothetical protein
MATITTTPNPIMRRSSKLTNSDKGNGPVQVAIQLGPFRNASNQVLRRVLKAKVRIQVMFRLQGIKGIKGQPSPLLKLQTAKEGRSNN